MQKMQKSGTKKSRHGAKEAPAEGERTGHAAFRVACCIYKDPRLASVSLSNKEPLELS